MDQPIMRKRGVYSIIVTILVVGVTTLACLLYIDRMQFGNRLQGRYQKELYDLIGNVQNLESDLSKVGVTTTQQQATLLFGDIWRQSGAAADRVNSLPVTHTAISQTSKFLAQVSDFAFSLVKTQSNGGKLLDGDWNTVASLKDNAAYLKGQLFALQKEMEDGNIKWSEIRYEGAKILGSAQTNITDSAFTDIDKEMQKSPTLIYDGPFSENVLNITPIVTREPEVNMEQAKQIVTDIIGKDKVQEIGNYSDKGDGRVSVYPFYVTIKGRSSDNKINIDISKNGGHIIYMLDDRPLGAETIDVKKGIDIGLKYLSDRGYKNMIPTFSQKSDSTLVTNYVYTESNMKSNIVIYPDQIKVKVALDNGDVIGVETEKYYTSHTTRKLPQAKLSVDKARAKVNKNLVVTNTRLVIIPQLSQKEIFCYEFVGTMNNGKFIVYINAENGSEENILQIIDTPGGELAM